MNLTTVYDKQMNPVAYLENTTAININRPENKLWTGGFSLPLDDPKNEFCQPFNRVRLYDNGEEVGLFRIMKHTIKKKGDKLHQYELEHVLGELIDPAIPGYHQTDNKTTAENIEFLLSFQKQQNWILGRCDFEFRYSYYWQNENGIYNALKSLTKPFNEPFQWTWDTSGTPFVLNLIRPSNEPKARIRAGYNMRGITKTEDPTKVITRIRPLGYSEGVNQLTIASVNGGDEWLTAEQEYIDQYGEVEKNMPDKTFRDADSLKAWGQALLDEYKKPPVTYQIDAAEVFSITGLPIDKFNTGDVIEITDPDLGTFNARVKKTSKPDITGDPGNVQLEIERNLEDIGDSIEKLREGQRVHDVYAQGATNIYAYSFNDNCDENYPAIIPFYIPPETVRNNKIYVSFRTEKFRMYVKSMQSAGQTLISTTSGPSSRQTTAGGGGDTSGPSSRQTTASGGGDTSAAGGDHKHLMWAPVEAGTYPTPSDFADRIASDPYTGGTVFFSLPANSAGAASTYGASGDHTHGLPTHTHGMDHTHELPTHSHGMDHTHQVEAEIEGHTHPQIPGIWEAPNLPTSISLEVDGNSIPNVNLNEDNFDIKPYLSKDANGEPVAGTTHELKIFPDDLARISANVFVQLFIESKS